VRRALVFALLAASLGLAGGPSSAAPAQALVLRGSRSASTVVDFVRPVAFDMYDDGGDQYARGVTATYAGGYVGIAVRRLDGRLVFARIVVRGFESTAYSIPIRHLVVLGDLHDDVTVPAGRYRVSLLADGQSELRIRTRGLPATRVLVPSGPERFRGQRLDLRAGGVAPVGVGRVEDVEVRATSIPVLASFEEFLGIGYRRVDYCFTNEADCALSQRGGSGGGEGGGSVGGTQTGFGDQPWFRAGRYDVVFRITSAGVPTTLSGFVAVLD
jgi:hypothetical protein